MSAEQYPVRLWIEELRRDGSVVVRMHSAGEAQEWRAVMRRACRTAGLRVRTGLSGGDGVAWAYHVDHVVTAASSQAANRAIEAALAGDTTVPFHELVREEQRKMFRPVSRPPGRG